MCENGWRSTPGSLLRPKRSRGRPRRRRLRTAGRVPSCGEAISGERGMTHIREASSGDLPALGRLFDEYRQFYKLPTDVERATEYITARLAARDSVVLVAVDESGE